MGIIKIKQRESDNKPTRYFSSRQEKQIAKATKGKQTKNSGATCYEKGDVLTDQFLLEAKTKTTHSDSITIKKEWFDKNLKETLITGKPYSAIVFNFGPDEKNYYIVDEKLFQSLLEYLKNNSQDF